MVVYIVPEVEIVAEQRQAGRHRDARQDQRHRVLAAARRGIRVPAGKQQQQRQVQHRRQQHEDDQPGQAVDGLLGQSNAVQVKLAFAVSQGRGQVLHSGAVTHPQAGGHRSMAVVQRYGISSDSRWIALAGKRQRARTVQCIKGRCVRCLTGEILNRHLIRAGLYGTACRRKGDYFSLRRNKILAGVPDLQRRPVLVHSGDLRVVDAKIRRGQLQFVGCAEQRCCQRGQHSSLQQEHHGKPAVRAQQFTQFFHTKGPPQPSQIMTLAFRMEVSSTVAMYSPFSLRGVRSQSSRQIWRGSSVPSARRTLYLMTALSGTSAPCT